jgi:hypothetical protein
MARNKKTGTLPPEEVDKTIEQNEAPKTKKGKKMQVVKEDIESDPLTDYLSGDALAEHGSVEERELEQIPDDSIKKPAPVTMQTKGIKINHVKMIRDLFLYVEYDKPTKDGMISVKATHEAPIHDDLRNAFNALSYHVANMGNQFNNHGLLDTENIQCAGMTVRSGNVYGVKLIGIRKVNEGKSQINVLPPFTKLGEGSSYAESADLEKGVDTLTSEVKQYLDGKHKPDVQASFEFGETEAAPVEHTTTVYPAKEAAPDLEKSDYVDLAI